MCCGLCCAAYGVSKAWAQAAIEAEGLREVTCRPVPVGFGDCNEGAVAFWEDNPDGLTLNVAMPGVEGREAALMFLRRSMQQQLEAVQGRP
jgi:hypothetical protein